MVESPSAGVQYRPVYRIAQKAVVLPSREHDIEVNGRSALLEKSIGEWPR